MNYNYYNSIIQLNEKEYIKMVTKCCIKQDVKEYMKYVCQYRLTNIEHITNKEAMIICVFNCIVLIVLSVIIIETSIIALVLLWIQNGEFSEKHIILFSSCINTTIIIGVIEELYNTSVAFFCKCEKQHIIVASVPIQITQTTQTTQTDQ